MGVKENTLQAKLWRWKNAARKGESRVEPALKTSRFRTRKPIGSSCVRNLDNNSRAATAKTPVNQASRAKSNFAKMRVFRRLRSTPNSRLISAVTKTQKLACEAPPVSSADNRLGGLAFGRSAALSHAASRAVPHEATEGAALAAALSESAPATITAGLGRSRDSTHDAAATSAGYAESSSAKRRLTGCVKTS